MKTEQQMKADQLVALTAALLTADPKIQMAFFPKWDGWNTEAVIDSVLDAADELLSRIQKRAEGASDC